MNPGTINTLDVSQKFNPILLLDKFASAQANGYLRVTHNSAVWLIYFRQGKLVFATHSFEIFERTERQLRRITNASKKSLDSEIYTTLRLQFTTSAIEDSYPSCDYQAISCLFKNNHITESETVALLKNITKEVLTTFLLLTSAEYQFIENTRQFPVYWNSNFLLVVKECQDDLHGWQALGPKICSPYQRPYLANPDHQLVTPEMREKLKRILIGFNFRQLSLLLNQDELKVAQNLYKLIVAGVIALKEPESPFYELPNFYIPKEEETHKSIEPPSNQPPADITSRIYRIACVDDSPTILREINRFLDQESFMVFPIVDSGSALMKIIRINPDLILLDVGMPTIDGYKLCSMLRKHNLFKKTPIIMVTGNTGIIDRAKAKMAGSTDYMTKPFTQSGLIEMVSKYLIE